MLKRLSNVLQKNVFGKVERELVQKEIDSVIQELRKFSLGATTSAQHNASDLILQTESPDKLFQMGNVTYENSTSDDRIARSKAIEFWKAAMDKGHDSAKYSYAECIRRGEGNERKPEPKRAFQIFEELAEQKHPWGSYALADMLNKGEGVRKNINKAFKMYKQSAELHVPPAYFNVGNMYATGTGVKRDIGVAIEWYEKAVEIGDPQAKSTLGDMYCSENGPVAQNMALGFKLRKEAAVHGIPMALYNVGWHYMAGVQVEQDYFKAAEYFRKASNKGVAMAIVNLGILHRDGLGVKRDPNEARRLFKMAAPHDTYAAELLASMKS